MSSNLCLGRELRKGRALNEAEMEESADRLAVRLASKIRSVRQPVAALSGGQRQTVAVARTPLGSPSVVILDEPTAAPSVVRSAEVLNTIERLRDLDHGVILIWRNLIDAQAVADRIVALRHGPDNGAYAADEVTYEEALAAITGARVDLSPMSAARPAPVTPARPAAQKSWRLANRRA